MIHIVKAGDTLYKIANMHNTTIEKLVEANGLTRPNDLVVGQSIFVPTDMPTTYTVVRGDTLYAIARRLYDEHKIILSPMQLVSVVKRIYPKITEEEREFYWKKFNIDVDAEACAQVTKIIGSYFKKGI